MKTLEQLDEELDFARENFITAVRDSKPIEIVKCWETAYKFASDKYYGLKYNQQKRIEQDTELNIGDLGLLRVINKKEDNGEWD